LAWYNKINNANRIRAGTVIVIPSIENIKKAEPRYAQQKVKSPTRAAAPTRNIRDIQIRYESRMNGDIDGTGVVAHFFIVNPPADLRSYEWDLGDGKRSFRESPSYEYSTPKTYVVRLTAQGGNGIIYKSKPLYIDIPYPTSTEEHSTVKFITLSSLDEYFVVNGTVKSVARYARVEDAPLDLSESDQFLTKVRFKKPGFYGITVQIDGGREQYYSIFASPLATMHADVAFENFNWYRTVQHRDSFQLRPRFGFNGHRLGKGQLFPWCRQYARPWAGTVTGPRVLRILSGLSGPREFPPR